MAVAALLAGACSASPASGGGGAGGALVPDVAKVFAGGTFPVELVVEPQTVVAEFPLFGVIPCTSTTVTPSVDVRGTLTVAPATLAPDLSKITIPGASLELPGATVSAGSLSLACNGIHLGAVGVSLRFDALASVAEVVLDPVARTLTLAEPSVTVTNVRATFTGAPPGTSPTPLAPVTVAAPTVTVAL